MKNQEDYIRITLRCPPELHRLLQKAAKKSGYSLNSTIISNLNLAIQHQGTGNNPKYSAFVLLEEIRQATDKLAVIHKELPSDK